MSESQRRSQPSAPERSTQPPAVAPPVSRTKVLLAALGTIAASMVMCGVFPVPFVWIFFAWAGLFLGLAMVLRRKALKLIAFNLGCLVLLLAAIESVLWLFPTLGRSSGHGAVLEQKDLAGRGFFAVHRDLGYGPVPGAHLMSRKRFGEEILYDVDYTIDFRGLRVSDQPVDRNNDAPEAILFFGCSHTFGEGVDDDEATPYLIGARKENRSKVLNFGFMGYGPHQMLAALESGIVEDALAGSKPKIVVHQAMHHHVWRSAGRAPWDRDGPRYTADANGDVRFSGSFALHPDLWDLLRPWIARSSIGARLIEREWFPPTFRSDVERYLAILKKSQQTIETRYPGAAFHVILWDWQDGSWITRAIQEDLTTRSVQLHRISEILPDFHTAAEKYRISRDGHPNALAHREIAQYILREIIPGDAATPAN